jgi:hypothetical protein
MTLPRSAARSKPTRPDRRHEMILQYIRVTSPLLVAVASLVTAVRVSVS